MLSVPDPKTDDCNCGHKRTVSNVTNITMVSNDSNPECDCLNMDNFQDSTSGNRFRDLNNIEFSALKSDQPITDAIIKGEPIKTLISFIFFAFSMVTTTLALALTHDRVPYSYDLQNFTKPLPDVILDNIKYQKWGLDASESFLLILVIMAFTVTLFHKHRCIIWRRMFLLVGIHYYYRGVTMFITVLPRPNQDYECRDKLPYENITSSVILHRVFTLLLGGGLTINGKHVYCGDYIYSGHTTTLIIAYLCIRDYSPPRWILLKWISYVVCIMGIISLLLSRGHYSIDVVIAYWVTTRLWWIFHTLASNESLKSLNNEENYLKQMWWWYIFRYFEGNVPAKLPREYNWPIPEKILQLISSKRKNRQFDDSETDIESRNRKFPQNCFPGSCCLADLV